MMSSKSVKKRTSLFEKLDEAYYSEWFAKYSQAILIAMAVVCIAIFIGVRLGGGVKERSEGDYLRVQREFVQLQKGDQEAFEELNRILLRKPDLQAKYDGMVAQTLLTQHQVKKAKPLVERSLHRIKSNHLAFYSDYTRANVLMGEGEYGRALEEALALREQMIENAKSPNRSFGDILFAYNLLRIGLLHRHMGDAAAEKLVWQELKGYARVSDTAAPTDLFSPLAFRTMLSQYEEGKVSLLQYVEKSESST